MTPDLFLLSGSGALVPMSAQPYASEDVLQQLIARYPDLLAGGQINPGNPRRWLLVAREAGIPGEEAGGDRWYLDHLLIDQDGVLTLVEVKRSTDTRIRREVVGQMLDYAANLTAHWTVERIQSSLEAQAATEGRAPSQLLEALLGPGADPDDFWQRVKTSLQAGRIRLIFVADEIPPELARVVEFLNEQMDPAEILAVEIRQYVGEGVTTVAPRLVGQTERAEFKKAGGARPAVTWNEQSFYASLEERNGPEVSALIRRLVDWTTSHGARVSYGKGTQDGSIYPVWDRSGESYWAFGVYTYGSLEIPFQWLKDRPPFDREELRRQYLDHLNAVPGVKVPPEKLGMRPPIKATQLLSSQAERQFIAALEWFLAQLPASDGGKAL